MKISKATQWILTIGILAVLLVGAGVAYSRQKAEQSRISADTARAQQDFIKYTEQKRDLETRHSQIESYLVSVQDEFRQYTESIEIEETIFEAADDADVTIASLTCPLPKDEEVNGINYKAFSFTNIKAEGEVVDLLRFSRKVSERFAAATIERETISVGGTSTLNLSIKVYFL